MSRSFKWIAVIICVIYSVSRSCNGTSCEDLSHRVVRALEKAMGFFALEYGEVNLDAVVGVRIAQSQIQSALAELGFDSNSKLKPLRADLERLSDLAESVCNRAIPVVKRQYPKDYRDLGILVNEDFWSTRSVVRKRTDPSLSSSPKQVTDTETLSEPVTDKCISELLGIHWGARLTSLRDFPAEMSTVNVNSLMDGFCSDVLSEAEATAENGFPVDKQDLFMEQVLLCGLTGYEDFFQLPWLQAVLSWQDESGCFANVDYRPHTAEIKHAEFNREDGNGYVRERRREKELTGNSCLIHKTSVGVGLLSGYLRALLESIALLESTAPPTDCLI